MTSAEHKNIILCGMMGCGKTTCSALLGRILGREVVDTDDLVVKIGGMSITEQFARLGENAMRDFETEACRQLKDKSGLVIACGGGLPLREENRLLLRQTGIVFYLRRDPGETYDTCDLSDRPLAQAGREAFIARFHDRDGVYTAFSHHIIRNFSSPEETVNEILTVLEAAQ